MIAVEIKIFQKLIVDMAFKVMISILDETIRLKYFETCTVSHILLVDRSMLQTFLSFSLSLDYITQNNIHQSFSSKDM